MISVKQISFHSRQYEEMIVLRVEALLLPIGIPATYIVPGNEKDDLFIAAFENEKMVGCCVLTEKENGVVQLRQMAVHSEWQGKGVGAAIISFAEETARKRGFHLMMMHARDPVIVFYEKCGYSIVGEPFFEVGMGHHCMQKKL